MVTQSYPGSARDLAEELREYTAMKYMGDCKCGKCQLVPRALVERIYHTLNSTGGVAQASANCDCGFSADVCKTNPCMRKKMATSGLNPDAKYPYCGTECAAQEARILDRCQPSRAER